MTKSQAGRLGGLSTVKNYGRGYMSIIGKRGARTTWTRYYLVPVGTSNFAMTNKQTGEVVAYMLPWRM